MSFWHETHPLMWKLKQVEKALPLWGKSDNENFSDSTNEDLTEAANLLCLVHDFFNNGSLDANIEVRYSRYMEESKNGAQFCKDWFDQVMYWYKHDCMPSDEDQEYYCTRWIESMLNSIDFEYDESKKPKSPKAKLDKKLARAKKRKRDVEEKELRRKYKEQHGKRFRRKTDDALKELRAFKWPNQDELVETRRAWLEELEEY